MIIGNFGIFLLNQKRPRIATNGTTYKRHMAIARGLMSEDDYLLQEILFNPRTNEQLDNIKNKLTVLQSIIERRDSDAMKQFLNEVRDNLK